MNIIDRFGDSFGLSGRCVSLCSSPVFANDVAGAIDLNTMATQSVEFFRILCGAVWMKLFLQHAPGPIHFFVACCRFYLQHTISACKFVDRGFGIRGRSSRVVAVSGGCTAEVKRHPFYSSCFGSGSKRNADEAQVPGEQADRRTQQRPPDNPFGVGCERQSGVPGKHSALLEQVVARRDGEGHRGAACEDLAVQKGKCWACRLEEIQQGQLPERNLRIFHFVEMLTKQSIEAVCRVDRQEQYSRFWPSYEVEKFRRIELEGFGHNIVTASLYCSYYLAEFATSSGKCNPEMHPAVPSWVM